MRSKHFLIGILVLSAIIVALAVGLTVLLGLGKSGVQGPAKRLLRITDPEQLVMAPAPARTQQLDELEREQSVIRSTGIQELWTDIVPSLGVLRGPPGIYGLMAQILFGIIQDGGGGEVFGGHIIHIPPWGPPELDILLGVASHRIATLVSSREGIGLQKAAMNMVAKVAQQEIKRLEGKG